MTFNLEEKKEELTKICIEKYEEATKNSIFHKFSENDIWVIENVVNIVVDLMEIEYKKQDKEFIKKLKEEVMDLSILQKNAHLDFKAEFVTILEDKIDKLARELK